MAFHTLTDAEEVYFGKAKDVVGDLRSEHLLGPPFRRVSY